MNKPDYNKLMYEEISKGGAAGKKTAAARLLRALLYRLP